MFAFLLTNATFSPTFSADLFCKYFFFFFAGGLVYNKREAFMSFLHSYGNLITFITICLLLLDLFIGLILPFQLLSIGVIASVLHLSNLNWPELISKLFITLGVSSFAIYIVNGPVLDLYYIIYKNYMGMPINGVFIFTSLIIAVAFSIAIRFLFNKVVPSRIYSL
jgi:peptidoglycan/LPS O-acetylase OafA/YrhL